MIGPGVLVEVLHGLSKGLRGVVRSRAAITFGGIPMWCVDLSAILIGRTIRQDYLQPVTDA